MVKVLESVFKITKFLLMNFPIYQALQFYSCNRTQKMLNKYTFFDLSDYRIIVLANLGGVRGAPVC